VSKLSKKQRHQVKSRWYYIFWGTATVTVFAGQMYVGNGFRRMAESFDNALNAPILLEFGFRRHTGRPFMPSPDVWEEWEEEGMWHPTDPPQRVY
tara:strand:- start:905 stop:1189 length:285 start_codon:yes stop_codon:yes gene_type:complete